MATYYRPGQADSQITLSDADLKKYYGGSAQGLLNSGYVQGIYNPITPTVAPVAQVAPPVGGTTLTWNGSGYTSTPTATTMSWQNASGSQQDAFSHAYQAAFPDKYGSANISQLYNQSGGDISKLTPAKMEQAKPIEVPPTPTPITNPAANVASNTVVADIAQRQANYEATKTAEQKQSEGLSTDIASLLGQETGKSAFISEQRHLKEDQLNKDLTNVQNQLKSIDAQQVQARLDAEGQPMTLSRLTGEKARQDALFNSQKLTLSAQANMLMGNISLAETQLQQSVDEKFGPIEESIRIKESQLQALQPILTKQEKIQADALQANYDAQKLAVAEKKQEEKDIQSLKLEAMKAGLTDQNILAKFDKANLQQAQNIAAPYLSKEQQLKNQLTQSEITKNLAQAAKDRVVAPGSTYTPGSNPVVDSWAERIQSGQAKITDIPAKEAGLRNQVTVALSAMGNSLDGKPTVTEMGKAALETAKTLLDKFTKGEGTSAVGKSAFLGSFGYGLIPGTARANFVSDFNSLKSQLSLEGVKFLKGQGQVSDAERALLAQAVTKLNLSQSEDEFKTTLKGIISKLNGTSISILIPLPDGISAIFSDQASADAFKKAAGITSTPK